MTNKHIDIDKIIIVILSLVMAGALVGCQPAENPSEPYKESGALKFADDCENAACYLGVTGEEARIMPLYKYKYAGITHSPTALLRELNSTGASDMGGIRVRMTGYIERDLAKPAADGTHVVLPVLDLVRKGNWPYVMCRMPVAHFASLPVGHGAVRVTGSPTLLTKTTDGHPIIELKTCYLEWYDIVP